MFTLEKDPNHEFFNTKRAMERYRNIKQDESHWLEVKNSGKGHVHMDFVSNKRSQSVARERSPSPPPPEEEDIFDLVLKPGRHKEKAAVKKLRASRKKTKELMNLFGIDPNQFTFKKPEKSNRPMKFIKVREIRKPCGLCEHVFPLGALVGEQLRSSICQLREIFHKMETKRQAEKAAVENSTSPYPTIVSDAQPETRVDGRSSGGKFRYSRRYDKVKVCRFCNQFFPFDAFSKSIGVYRSASQAMLHDLNQELLTNAGPNNNDEDDDADNDDKSWKSESGDGSGKLNGTVRPIPPSQRLKADSPFPLVPISMARGNSVKGGGRQATPEMPIEIPPEVVLPRRGKKPKPKTEAQLVEELERIKCIVTAMEKRLKGKKMSGFGETIEGFLREEDSEPWCPNGTQNQSNDCTISGVCQPRSTVSFMSPHRPTTANPSPKQEGTFRRVETSLTSESGRHIIGEGEDRISKMRHPTITMKEQIRQELRRMYAEDGCLALDKKKEKRPKQGRLVFDGSS